MGRREGPSEERRVAILQAADEVFGEKGYAAASIREIASRAGVSSALLYWFFPDKAALFIAALAARVLDGDFPAFFPHEFLDLPPEVVISFIAERYLDIMSQPEQIRMLRQMVSEGQREPELIGRLVGVLQRRVFGPFSQYLARQVELGRMRDLEPELAVQALFGMLISVIMRREIMQEKTIARFSNEQVAAALSDIYLNGAAGSGKGPDLAVLKPAERVGERKAVKVELED